jgi:mannose-1-phosphate guanylyltransferase
MNAVILVGGGGTRLRPLTYAVPKPLIPVVNRPLITHLIGNLRRHGVTDVVLAASAADKRIEEALGDGRELGVGLSYCYETEPLGSGLAVKQAARGFDRAFFVCNGDVISDIDLSRMREQHEQRRALLSISLSWVEDPSAFGVVELGDADRITRFVEKPPRTEAPSNWANAGTWLFEPDVLEHIPDERMDRSLEQLVFPSLIAEDFLVQGFPSRSYWMDVGTSERYLQLHADLLSGLLPGWVPDSLDRAAVYNGSTRLAADARVGPRVILGEACSLGESATVLGPSVLGNGCSLGEKARVEHSVLWSDVQVGAGALVRRGILGTGCEVGAGAVVDGAVLADRVRVLPGARLGPGARLEPGEVAS